MTFSFFPTDLSPHTNEKARPYRTYWSYRCRKNRIESFYCRKVSYLSEKYHTSIISSDSRQLYKDLKIGTAAPTPDQLKRVPHYFVGTLELTDYYSAAQFEAEVLKKLEELFKTHPVVVMTGGSMMYVDAVCKGIDDIPTVESAKV